MGVTEVIALGFVLAAASFTVISVARLVVKLYGGRPSEESAALEERVARLEHAVETLTVDAGRLIDGQRFLSQLLAERSGVGQPPGPRDRA
jgi:hypothetical protein